MGSEGERSDDEHHKKLNQKRLEKELSQVIYITITETPTNILFYCPSTKYLNLKNEEVIAQEKIKDQFYKDYLLKLKNKESFVRKGAQTISKFKSSDVVSTSFNKDTEGTLVDKKINCLNYVISDSYIGKKSKTDDQFIQTQKMLEKKVRKELKQTLKHTKDLVSVDSSTMTAIHRDAAGDVSESGQDSFISSSIQSSQKPKGSKLNAVSSHDKSNTNKEKQTSPNSSFAQNSKNSETQISKGNYQEPLVNNQIVKYAFNEELSKTIVYPLKYVERLLSQNQFHFRQIAYKDYPISKEEFQVKTKKKVADFASMGLGGDPIKEDDQATKNMQKEIALIIDDTNEPNIKKLFTYSVDILLQENNISTKYVVHAMDWNKNNPDLLAAVYGDPDINSKLPGFLCFWTLKNPLHPERVIKTPRGLTYCNFSRRNPYLIVVSDYRGEIMIYDLRNNTNKPIADSSEVKDKHTDIVWECKWIERPNDLKKDRTNPKDNKEIKETLIFRDANGLSFDFPKNDTTVYYVALEECTIHKCRISYRDQYIDNYYGHQGPVYKIRCNPFDPNILISCSYDWTVKIWNGKHNYPVMNLHTNELTHQVNDIEWSWDTSTVFGDVADDGRIEIWDLARSAIQPIIINMEDKAPKKSIKFSDAGKIVAAGDCEGCIVIYRIYNMEHSPVSDEHQIKRLQGIIQQNSDISSKV